MHNLKIVLDEGVEDPLCTFDAGYFFSVLRDAGGDPLVWNGSLYTCLPDPSERVTAMGKWAAVHDPRGEIRRAYARAAWGGRPPGTTLVKLG